jgi:drug/metabolite transporter (DMT)-like permease
MGKAATREDTAARRVISGAVLISFSSVYVKLAHVSPTVAGFYRVFFGGLLLLAIVGIRRERIWSGSRFFLLQVTSGLFFALDLIVWHWSIHLVGPGLATILANFQVFFLALIGVLFLRERMSLRLAFSIPLAMTGLILLVGIPWNRLDNIYRTGIFFGIGAAICYTGFLLTLKKLQGSGSPQSPAANLAVICSVAAAFLALDAIRMGDTFVIPDPETGVLLFAYGLFSQTIGWLLISRGVPNIRASLAGLLLLLQPALAFLWDILFFARPTTPLNMLGAVLALTAIYLGMTSRPK